MTHSIAMAIRRFDEERMIVPVLVGHTIDPDEFSFGRSLNREITVATGDVVDIASASIYPVADGGVPAKVASE